MLYELNAIGTIIPGQLYTVIGKPLPYKNGATKDHGVRDWLITLFSMLPKIDVCQYQYSSTVARLW